MSSKLKPRLGEGFLMSGSFREKPTAAVGRPLPTADVGYPVAQLGGQLSGGEIARPTALADQTRPSGFSKAARRSNRLPSGSTSPKQPFVATITRP
jgi:hypothetical protein